MSIEIAEGSLDPYEEASLMSQWYRQYINELTDVPGYLPSLTLTRLKEMYGLDLAPEECLEKTRKTLKSLESDPSHYHNFNLFICGYPEEDLFKYGIGDVSESLEKLHGLKEHMPNLQDEDYEPERRKPQGKAVFVKLGAPAISRSIVVVGAGAISSVSELRTDEENWQELALCKETDPEMFFPEKGGSTREAKLVCSKCEVQKDCLDFALHNEERFGVWGGMSERDRRRLRRGIVSVKESAKISSKDMESVQLVLDTPHLRVNQFFTILSQEDERDDEFEEDVEYDEQLRVELVNIVFQKLYINAVKKPDHERLGRLTRYFGISYGDGKDAEWTIANRNILERDLRLFNEVMQKIHRDYAAISSIGDVDNPDTLLDMCRQFLVNKEQTVSA